MLSLLENNPLLTVFFVVAAGAALGQIPIWKIKFGAAGALFVGLILSSVAPRLGDGMDLLLALGLAFFVYAVGLTAGQSFFSDLREQTSLLMASAVALVAGTVADIVLGKILAMTEGLTTGIFAGALTAAPAVDTATRLTQSPQAAVGYAFGYPLAVTVGIIVVSVITPMKWKEKNDTPSLADVGLVPLTVEVSGTISTRKIPGVQEERVRLSYLLRDDRMRVVMPGEELIPGDQVVMVGWPEAVEEAASAVGALQKHHLQDDRSNVVFEPVTISRTRHYGATIAELNLPSKFGAVVTRVHRGDLDLLATDGMRLEPADTIQVVCPRSEMRALRSYLGDSVTNIKHVNALSLGLGLVLGVLLGLISIPLPGGAAFALGPAAGPLLVGLMLGALRRTGPLIWTMPQAANMTLRQLGLLLFMAGLGLTAGPSFLELAISYAGLWAGILAVVVTFVTCVVLVVIMYFMGLSAPRSGGAVAGILGAPVILDSAKGLVSDERIESAYVALFAFTTIVKILLIPVIVAF